jgi:osmotically inducible lipoprotein OsmB
MNNTQHICTLALCTMLLASCSNMTPTQQRVLSGAGIGAAAGTAGAAMTGGCISCGAAIGTAVGAGAGLIVDQQEKNKKK